MADLRVLHAVDDYAVQLLRVSLQVDTVIELLVDDVIAELDSPRLRGGVGVATSCVLFPKPTVAHLRDVIDVGLL